MLALFDYYFLLPVLPLDNNVVCSMLLLAAKKYADNTNERQTLTKKKKKKRIMYSATTLRIEHFHRKQNKNGKHSFKRTNFLWKMAICNMQQSHI